MSSHSFGRVATVGSRSIGEARKKVINVYRRIARMLPSVLKRYEIYDVPVPKARSNLAKHFRKYADVAEPQVIDTLRFKAEMDMYEALAMFKTRSHVYDMVKDVPVTKHSSEFMRRFTNGKD
jgi:hypothetical protein